jgi:H/ACA ribonucleoprotein complex subunit 2
MGKDRSVEKKEKKEKRSDKDGVKKSKKDKKPKVSDAAAAAIEAQVEDSDAPVAEVKVLASKDAEGELVIKPVGALVPFAAPLADEKVAKKVLKSVKKGMF